MKTFFLPILLILTSPLLAHEEEEVFRLKRSEFKNSLQELDILGLDGDDLLFRIPGGLHEKMKEFPFEAAHIDMLPQSQAGYKTPSEVTEILWKMTQDHPGFVRGFELGLSSDGRSIRSVEITDFSHNKTKPAVLFNGMHHARELMTTEVVLDIGLQLLALKDTDPEVKSWLENYRIFLVPQVNPDGNQKVHDGDRWWRKNTYKRGDRVLGVDLNRNYPTTWDACNGSSGTPSNDTYRGPTAGSEPETKAMMRLVQRIRPVFNISYHSYSELIIYPFGCNNKPNESLDRFKSIANKINEGVENDQGQKNKYKIGRAPELLYEADGSDLDFQWAEHGVIAYTIEVNSSNAGFQPDYASMRDITVKRQRGGWMNLMRELEGSGVSLVDKDAVSYAIEKQQGNNFVPFAEGRTKTRYYPREGGMIHHLLPAGATYRLSVAHKNGRKIDHVFKTASTMLTLRSQ